jgi:hypothetical protein
MNIGASLSKLTNTIFFEISAKGWVALSAGFRETALNLTYFISVIFVAFTPVFAITFWVILADFFLHFVVFFLE